MGSRDLKKKPLVEALLEVRWKLSSPAPGVEIDPHYKVLIGRLYDRVARDYPEHEQLPAAALPDGFAGHVVQHRFRCGANDWPLVQIGPGILTVNETDKYTWTDFCQRAIAAVGALFDSYPKGDELQIESLLLRYIDGIHFDYLSESIFEFLEEKMKVGIELPQGLFDPERVRSRPRHFNWQSSFECLQPRGVVTARFATGEKKGAPALIWETMVRSAAAELPELPEGFEAWMDAAHSITDDWFFKLIEGDLEKEFHGD